MATFSAATFSTAQYALFRPTYPASLFTEFLLPYHRGTRSTLLDLGCGPGTVTRPLSAYFVHTVGTDPSESMLETARTLTPSSEYPGVTYHAAPAERLEFLRDGEVDMVVSGQAAHWFNHDEWWQEMSRVVRPGGTVAVWGYKDFLFPKHPSASAILQRFMSGADRLGPYWSQPGRQIVEDRYRAIRPPESQWRDVLRWEHEPEFEVAASVQEAEARVPVQGVDGKGGFGTLVKKEQTLMRKKLPLGGLDSYIRTWSSVHTWKEKHPEETSKADGGRGDIVDEFMEQIVDEEGWGTDDEWKEKEVEIAWGHGVIVARKK